MLEKKSQIDILKFSIAKANIQWWPIIKQNWLILLLITLFVQAQAQFFLYSAKTFEYNQGIQFLSQIGLGLMSLIESVFLVMLVPLRINELEQHSSKENFWTFFKKHIGPLTIEGLRMSAYVILWALLLILPGLYKQIRWYFLPFVVMFDPLYEKGEVDCLKRSNNLTAGVFFLLVALMLIDFSLQQGTDSFAMSASSNLQPITVVIAGILTMGVSIYTYSLYYWIYRQRVEILELHEPSERENND